MNEFVDLFERPICRINVVGTSGSGKSTLSKRLSVLLQYPYIEMDKIFWGPNWTESNDEAFFANLKSALDKPQWVLDGNYTRAIPIKWENIDLVIWLDYSFPLTLFQAIRRAVQRSWTKEEIWGGTGNRESFKKSFFSKESIIWWTITTHGKVRKNYEKHMANPRLSHIKFIRLRSRVEADRLIEAFKEHQSQ